MITRIHRPTVYPKRRRGRRDGWPVGFDTPWEYGTIHGMGRPQPSIAAPDEVHAR